MKRARWFLFTLACLLTGRPAQGHDLRPGYLELRETAPGVYAFLWKKPVGEERSDMIPVFPQGWRVETPAGASLAPGSFLVRGTLRGPDGLAGTTLRVSGLEATTADVLVHIEHAGGRVENYVLRPAHPIVTLGGETSGLRRALAFGRLGLEHILLGVDHLLFVLGLLLIVAHRWMLVKTITAFTLAHSVTLAVATLARVAAPVAPLNASIALSILFLGPEIVRAGRGERSFTLSHPWVVAFAFGLLHGFGFASGLTTMGLPRSEIPVALLLFNVGVEVGQILFVGLILLLIRAFRILEIRWPRVVAALPGYAVGTLGAYWTIQRAVMLWNAGGGR